MPELSRRLLCAVAAGLPGGADVMLPADCGLAEGVDACAEMGWRHVIRPRRGRTACGRDCTAAELSPHPGASSRGESGCSTSRGGGRQR